MLCLSVSADIILNPGNDGDDNDEITAMIMMGQICFAEWGFGLLRRQMWITWILPNSCTHKVEQQGQSSRYHAINKPLPKPMITKSRALYNLPNLLVMAKGTNFWKVGQLNQIWTGGVLMQVMEMDIVHKLPSTKDGLLEYLTFAV